MKRIAAISALGGLALSASASAQEAQVSLYGAVQPFVDNFRVSGEHAIEQGRP